MKKHAKSHLLAALQSLGIILQIFFTLAFACKNDNENPPRLTDKQQTKNKVGACSTKEEFKAIITHEKTYLARNYEEKQVIFNSFETEGPMHYENTENY